MEGAPEIVVRTLRSHYTGGDTIDGCVYANIPSGCKATAIKLIIRGHELAEYDYQYVEESFQTKLSQRKARIDIIKTELKLVEHQDGFPEGRFAYPFRFQLPDCLPGVFNAKYEDPESGRAWQGVIKYTIGAQLENTGMPSEHRLLGETPLVILNSIKSTESSEEILTKGCVKSFFCISRGDVKVSSSLERRCYEPDSKVTVKIKLENTSPVDILGSTIKVIRVIKLYGQDKMRGEEERSAHTVYDTIMEIPHLGCPRKSKKEIPIELDLQKLSDTDIGIPCSTNGTLIGCRYVIDTEVHIPWAPDIEVRQPLVIKPTDDKEWESWQPPEWIRRCSSRPVTARCAVPDNILAVSFSGMPSFQPTL